MNQLTLVDREANRLVRNFARFKRRVRYVDIWNPMLGSNGEPKPELFAKDGLHLSDAGYQLWTKQVKRKL